MRVTVIGAGAVGLATAFHLHQQGATVTVVDREPAGDKASFGNAGGIAVTEILPAAVPGIAWKLPRWLLDPLGPLSIRPRHAPFLAPFLRRFSRAARQAETQRIVTALAALNGRVYADLVPMLAATGMTQELHRLGALNVYETEAGFRADAGLWQLKRAHGIEAIELTEPELREQEPALGKLARRGVLEPQWSSVSDPKRIVDGLRRWLLDAGACFVSGRVQRVEGLAIVLEDGKQVVGDRLVIAAGAWSGRLARQLGERAVLESERGYNMTIPDPGMQLRRHLVFAERHFVAAPLQCGLRIGGAAEFGGLCAVADYRRSRALVTLAARYLPQLRHEGGVSWAGHRPSTPDSLPVIGPSRSRPGAFYAFGHGHLGLTQSATTGRLVADLVLGRPATLDLTPYSIARFA